MTQDRITITVNPSSEYERRVKEALGTLPHGFKKRFFFDCVMRALAPPHLSVHEIAARVRAIVDTRELGIPAPGLPPTPVAPRDPVRRSRILGVPG